MRTSGLVTSSIVPVLRYRDPAQALVWLGCAFGFVARDVARADNGEVIAAKLVLGPSMVMIGRVGETGFDPLMKQPDEVDGATTQISYFIVPDIDAHYEQAKAAGALIAQDLADYDQGGRGYSCRDPEGHVWSFGSFDPWGSAAKMLPAQPSRACNARVVATSLTMALAVVTASWMLVAPPARHGVILESSQHITSEVALDHGRADARAAQRADDERDTVLAAQVSQAPQREADVRRLIDQAREKTAHLDSQLQAAIAAENAATQALGALDQELRMSQTAQVRAEQRVAALTAELEIAQAMIAHVGQIFREAQHQLEGERAMHQQAQHAYEQQRQQLQQQLDVAERTRQLTALQLEELLRRRTAAASRQAASEERNFTVAEPRMNQPKATARRAVKKVPSLLRQTALRRRCAEIKANPDDYERALVDLCRTL